MIWEIGSEIRRLPASIETPVLRKSEALSGNERNLAGEFCVVDGEFSDLRCLMNTLIIAVCKLAFIENLCSLL